MIETFRESASGLMVPAELSREREVWTREEWKSLERVVKLARARGLDVFLGCQASGCKRQPITRIRNADGTFTL